jgi:hypothetical protein
LYPFRVADLKTGDREGWHRHQLAAYTFGVPMAGAIVYLEPDRHRIEHYSLDDMARLWREWTACVTAYHALHEGPK